MSKISGNGHIDHQPVGIDWEEVNKRNAAQGVPLAQVQSTVQILVSSAACGVGDHHHASPPPSAHEISDAAGAIAHYMKDEHVKKLDIRDLYELSKDNSAPKEAREAAKFMLANPDVYKKIEDSAAGCADGVASIKNFKRAVVEAEVASAAGAIADYMKHEATQCKHSAKKLDVGDLRDLAKDTSAPKEVREAAEFFLEHPKAFKKLVDGADGHKDGFATRINFQQAAETFASESHAVAATIGYSPSGPAVAMIAELLDKTGEHQDNKNVSHSLDGPSIAMTAINAMGSAAS